MLPRSSTFEILRALGLIDLVTTGGFTDTRTSQYPKQDRYADYLLVSPNVKVVDFEVVAEPEVSIGLSCLRPLSRHNRLRPANIIVPSHWR
ncbi:hypothetical protein B5P45_03940 [Phyllobacterium zundukense]|uniref:Uncharacterized protein n=1 Tax=Phyllobacterium zundukense TaxID=1867719 RepID=A0A2N9W339_9HYPH|nr:hypothetical protein BLM14_21440 [Phyllobacterium zundukense]PIO46157.1 hypothetical protein B5P45_03940 [Phyllobacterium zundukense]